MNHVSLFCQPPPNPTNTVTNASATGDGAGCGDSAAISVTITAEASHKWTDDVTGWFITSGRKVRTTKTTQTTLGRGYAGWGALQ